LNSPESFAVIGLSGKYHIRINDQSCVYFGDYHRVSLEVICEFPVTGNAESHDELLESGENVAIFSRILEKMAVPSAVLHETKLALIDEFRRTTLPYLESAAFPDKLAARTFSRQISAKKRKTMRTA
jgi:hypothetical protein